MYLLLQVEFSAALGFNEPDSAVGGGDDEVWGVVGGVAVRQPQRHGWSEWYAKQVSTALEDVAVIVFC